MRQCLIGEPCAQKGRALAALRSLVGSVTTGRIMSFVQYSRARQPLENISRR